MWFINETALSMFFSLLMFFFCILLDYFQIKHVENARKKSVKVNMFSTILHRSNGTSREVMRCWWANRRVKCHRIRTITFDWLESVNSALFPYIFPFATICYHRLSVASIDWRRSHLTWTTFPCKSFYQNNFRCLCQSVSSRHFITRSP